MDPVDPVEGESAAEPGRALEVAPLAAGVFGGTEKCRGRSLSAVRHGTASFSGAARRGASEARRCDGLMSLEHPKKPTWFYMKEKQLIIVGVRS